MSIIDINLSGNTMTLPIKDNEFRLLNMHTGETTSLDIIESSDRPERWDKVYTKQLARMLELVGDERMKVIAYLIKRKDQYNGVNTTTKEISESTGVSMATVNRVMKKMQDHDYLHKVRNGKWRLSPRIICNGQHNIGMATINYYDNVD